MSTKTTTNMKMFYPCRRLLRDKRFERQVKCKAHLLNSGKKKTKSERFKNFTSPKMKKSIFKSMRVMKKRKTQCELCKITLKHKQTY